MSRRAIVILSAGVKKNKNSTWSNTNLTKQSNQYGAPGGKQRAVAASYLHKIIPDSFFIACGGRGRDGKNASVNRPNLCQITKNELLKLDIPENKIIVENKSNTTFEQLQELKKIILKFKLSPVIIISNKYHLPRLKAMIGMDTILNRYLVGGKINLASAEKILLRYNSEKWKKIIEQAYSSKWMRDRIKKEMQGVKDIKNNNYKF
jgi:uncharacterized SAM-binding protein YcdF (DUF218 family)